MLTDYISKELLAAEGFIHVTDTDAVMTAAFGTVPHMVDIRMGISDIAWWLNVSTRRLKRYINDNRQVGIQILGDDGCLSIRQIAATDWSRLINQKRTPRLSGSNFEGRKRRKPKPIKP